MAEGEALQAWPTPGLAEVQHWTSVLARMQQMLVEHGMRMAAKGFPQPGQLPSLPIFGPPALMMPNPAAMGRAAEAFWQDSLEFWQRFLDPAGAGPSKDRRFAGAAWSEHPAFDLIRQSYELLATHMLRSVEALDGGDEKGRAQLRFAMQALVDALSPSNFALTNPEVIRRTVETRGANLLKGLEHMLGDIERGQLTHVDRDAFEVGRNIAATPGKVVHETPLYQLIQYDPTTERVREIPLVIFPPWINRFYILDLNPQKSFVRWAVEQGITVFMVSWKSADESLRDIVLDDYVAAQLDAVDTIRAGLKVPAVNAIGYCVAGTTLAATLALLAARGEADKVRSATFFTAQVDFTAAGDLTHFVDDAQLDMLRQLSAGPGYTDGRYMAATFNLLRGRDLIWNYVVSNYLMGEDYPAFDLLHWNGDTTNLPATWHVNYLADFYRDNRLAQAGGIVVDGTPVDLGRVATPTYVQAGREDHIAPPQSVWKITEHFTGPLRFVLAGSGHIAGVVNPPSSGKYQYWTSDEPAATLDAFVAQAKETKGSWWPDWLAWLTPHSGGEVPAKGARVPGRGKLKAIEAAPGRYVKAR